MKILKTIVLELLLLIVMCFFGTIVMKIFDIIFKLDYENIFAIGFKVGFVGWIIIIILQIYNKIINIKK